MQYNTKGLNRILYLYEYMIIKERLYRLKEASEILGVHPRTIQRWDKKGIIRVVRTPNGRRRIPESEIKRLLGMNEVEKE